MVLLLWDGLSIIAVLHPMWLGLELIKSLDV